MGYKKLLINELEKKYILKQYNILTEAVSTEPVSTLVIDKIVKFPAGYWSEKQLEPILKSEMDKITQYLKGSTGKAFLVTVTIESFESKIPNVDAESGRKPLKPLELAGKRNVSIKSYITKQLQSFVDKKLLMGLPLFTVLAPKQGPTEWVGTPFCPKGSTEEQQRNECILNFRKGKDTTYKEYRDKYENEQRIRVYIKLEELTDMKKCLDNMVIEVNYTDLSKKHVCNSAIYEIYLNGVRLLRNDGNPFASLNNDGSRVKLHKGIEKYDNDINNVGGERYNKFVVTPELATTILSDTIKNMKKPRFTLSAKCINPFGTTAFNGGCHDGVGNIVITNGQKEVFEYTSATPTIKDSVKKLVTFNACGSGGVNT